MGEWQPCCLCVGFLDRLAASNEPSPTDHTGDIISFTDVGSGAGTDPPRPWVCYTSVTSNVEWQTPDGTTIATGANPAPDNDVVTRTNFVGIILSRGTGYFSPDGEYCCVRTGTTQRRCLTFSE